MRRKNITIRDAPIGQYRDHAMRAWESSDEKDRFRSWQPVRSTALPRKRRGLALAMACAHCGRTQDFWEENNGEGIAKQGRRFCCKPCSGGKACVCLEIENKKGQELNSLQRITRRKKH
jgi:hypothetical protein